VVDKQLWTWAQACVGRGLFGVDWIEGLSRREQFLIDQYVGEEVRLRSEIFPGDVVYVRSPRRPMPATLQAEIERAADRARYMSAQRCEVRAWLRRHWGKGSIAELHAVLAKTFCDRSVASVHAPSPPRKTPKEKNDDADATIDEVVNENTDRDGKIPNAKTIATKVYRRLRQKYPNGDHLTRTKIEDWLSPMGKLRPKYANRFRARSEKKRKG
jgi:hypothetical protein